MVVDRRPAGNLTDLRGGREAKKSKKRDKKEVFLHDPSPVRTAIAAEPPVLPAIFIPIMAHVFDVAV